MFSKNMKFACILILFYLVVNHNKIHAQDEFCSKDGSCQEYNEEKSLHDTEDAAVKYTKKGNEHWNQLQLIYEAQRKYRECPKNCSCLYPQIRKDLSPFKDGISRSLIEEARARGVLYQIIDGKIYRDKMCSFPSRCAGVEHFLYEIIDKLPNTELVVNVRDWPQVNTHRAPNKQLEPVFSFSKQESIQADILYPAWSFWEGGPAISLHPTGLGRWDLRRKSLIKANNKHKWSKKLDKAFFRGSRTSSARDGIVLLSRDEPNLADCQYTKNQAWKSEKDTLGMPAASEVSLENHCRYKYLFNFVGVAASFRFKHLFLCGSVVFHEETGWIEFFYPQMKPWIHYIPIPARARKEEIKELLLFAQQNDEAVRKIAKAGRDFIFDRLGMDDVNCYWKKLLLTYSKLLKYTPQQRKDLILIEKKVVE